MYQYEPYVNSEVLLDHKDTQIYGVVKGRKQEQGGTLRGKANAKPIVDTFFYDVSFPDRKKNSMLQTSLLIECGNKIIVR